MSPSYRDLEIVNKLKRYKRLLMRLGYGLKGASFSEGTHRGTFEKMT